MNLFEKNNNIFKKMRNKKYELTGNRLASKRVANEMMFVSGRASISRYFKFISSLR
jgi:hypothetical protein